MAGLLDNFEPGGAPPPPAAAGALPDRAPPTRGLLDGFDPNTAPTVKQAAEPPPVDRDAPPSMAVSRQAPGGEDLSFGDALSQAGKNLIPSSKRAITETARALTTDLPQTATAFKDLGKGVWSKLQGAVGVDQDPEEKARTERIADALGRHYADTYGDWGGFKKKLASDPASIAMDLSTPVSLGLGAGAKVAGVGRLGKTLSAASKAASFADPVSATMGVAGLGVKGLNSVAKGVLSKTASVPKTVLDLAEEAGKTPDKNLRSAFLRHYSGNADARELLDSAQQAVNNARQAHSAHYAQTSAGLAASAARPNYQPIVKSVQDELTRINGPGVRSQHQFTNINKMMDEIKLLVDDYANNPARHNYEELDRLKRAIVDKQHDYGFADHTPGGHAASAIANSVKKELDHIAPGYQQMMDHWSGWLREVQDLTQGLQLGKKVDANRALTRMMRAQKTDQGHDLLQTLAQYDPRLPYMVAGQTLRPGSHGGLRGMIDWGIAAGAAGTFMHPGPLAYLAAASPKATGALQLAHGAAQRGIASPTGRALRYGVYQLRPEDMDDPSLPRGLRNKNYGNIEDSPLMRSQPGYVGSDGRFAKFQTPEHGHAAGVTLLRSYGKMGNNTVRKIAERWTPPKRKGGENPDEVVDSKIREMAKYIGVSPDQQLDMNNTQLLRQIYESIVPTEGNYEVKRAARASGGRIIDHGSEADRLVKMAESGLKKQNQGTEQLLDLHDDTVAKALKTADSYI